MRSKSGFTLIELVMVIVVLAILTAIAIPVVTHTVNNAVLNSALTDCNTIHNSIVMAKADIQAKNNMSYGDDAINGTISVEQVIEYNGLREACEEKNYYGRQIVPVWNSDGGRVVVVYADDHKEVESGESVDNYIVIKDAGTTLIENLPES
jgi:prepilin-type N-terminal cleavage/methylation domain-containing protein